MGSKSVFFHLHLDTLVVSSILGIVFSLFFYKAAHAATSGVPGRIQNLVEVIIEFVDSQVYETLLVKDKFTKR